MMKKKALKLLVDTIGKVKSSVTFWLWSIQYTVKFMQAKINKTCT